MRRGKQRSQVPIQDHDTKNDVSLRVSSSRQSSNSVSCEGRSWTENSMPGRALSFLGEPDVTLAADSTPIFLALSGPKLPPHATDCHGLDARNHARGRADIPKHPITNGKRKPVPSRHD